MCDCVHFFGATIFLHTSSTFKLRYSFVLIQLIFVLLHLKSENSGAFGAASFDKLLQISQFHIILLT